MTIRNRLTLVLALTFSIIFMLTALLVYLGFYHTSERIIFDELRKAGSLAATFYLEEDELPTHDHQRIRHEFAAEVAGTDVKIYNTQNQLTYANGQLNTSISSKTLHKIRQHKQLDFKSGDYYYYGLLYTDNQGDFVVVVCTDNGFFATQGNQLLLIMGGALLLGLLIILITSFWLSRRAYRPVAHVIHQVNALDADTLNKPLALPDTKDELYQLVHTFNGLLKRLSETFVTQKNFINYVSHEFKTPLAAITGNLEVFAQQDRTPEEYRKLTPKLLGLVTQIEQLLDNLMLLAGLRKSSPQTKAFRIDELLWTVLDRVYLRWPIAKSLISVRLDVQHASALSVRGNSGQLEIALFNIIENAVKYSRDKPVEIVLASEQQGKGICMTVQDRGKGIPAQELPLIHQPFYRGSNVADTAGSGIGLSLAILICKQLGISLDIHSEERRGTRVILTWSDN